MIYNQHIMLPKFSTLFYSLWKFNDVPQFLSVSQDQFSQDLQSTMSPKKLKLLPYVPYPDKQ